MKRLGLVAALVAAVALPATSAADPPSQTDQRNAAQRCKTMRGAMGETLFRATFGTNPNGSNALGMCVSRMAQEEHENRHNAAQQCRTERRANPEAFRNRYGTNRNKSNAFGKCVSQQARAASNGDQQQLMNAARQCETERRANPEAFRNRYGTNRNKQNAFGKCVSEKAQD